MDRYYLEHITSLGCSHGVYSSEVIKNADGVNLIPKGMRINQHFLDLLLQHKLLKPIDECLEITDVLNASKLKSYAISAFEDLSDLRLFFEHLSDLTVLAGYINCVLLNKTLLNTRYLFERLCDRIGITARLHGILCVLQCGKVPSIIRLQDTG